MREDSIIAFDHVFIITFYAVNLQKLFFTDETGTQEIDSWKIAPQKIAPYIKPYHNPYPNTEGVGEFIVGQSFGEQSYEGRTFGHRRNIKIWYFQSDILSTLNIIYIKVIYIKGSFF